MIVEDNSEFYDPENRELPAGARCANHPEREATVVCEECSRPVCAECAPLKGGGHAFCKGCLAGSRLIDAEPIILGGPAEGAPAGGTPESAPVGGSRRLWRLLLALLVLATAAAILAWATVTGRL